MEGPYDYNSGAEKEVSSSSDTESQCLLSVRERSATITGLAGQVLVKRNLQSLAAAQARFVSWFVPLKIVLTASVVTSAVFLLSTDLKQMRSTCLGLFISIASL